MARSVTFRGGCGRRNPCSLDGLPCSTAANSLFPNLGKSPVSAPTRGRMREIGPVGNSELWRFPCVCPADQGFRSRDEFAPDCPHRQPVRVVGDGETEARVEPPKTPWLRGVMGERPGEAEPETAGSRRGRRRGPCLSVLPGSAVRLRRRFASAKTEANHLSHRPSFRRLRGRLPGSSYTRARTGLRHRYVWRHAPLRCDSHPIWVPAKSRRSILRSRAERRGLRCSCGQRENES